MCAYVSCLPEIETHCCLLNIKILDKTGQTQALLGCPAEVKLFTKNRFLKRLLKKKPIYTLDPVKWAFASLLNRHLSKIHPSGYILSAPVIDKLCFWEVCLTGFSPTSMFGARSDCKSRIYEPRNAAGQALASSFLTYLTPQFRGAGSAKCAKKRLSQNHNSLIFMTNPLQTCS
jgi:hypothetical protein